MAFDGDGTRLACQGTQGGLVWDVANWKELHSWSAAGKHEDGGCAFSADGKWLAAAAIDGIHVWDAHTYKAVHTLAAPNRRWLAFGADGRTLFAAHHSVAMALRVKEIEWRGIKYRLAGPRKVHLLHYSPYRPHLTAQKARVSL